MRCTSAIALLPLAASAVNVLVSNDDGWAEINIRSFYSALTSAGYSAIISAPAENQSGTGSSDATPKTVDSNGCEFSSCPAGAPATGTNSSMTRFNYVNSYPVTAVKYGVSTLAPKFFGGAPDIVVTGPNVGSNLGLVAFFSGTIGAATEAAKEGIPAIAFSGTSGTATAWNAVFLQALGQCESADAGADDQNWGWHCPSHAAHCGAPIIQVGQRGIFG